MNEPATRGMPLDGPADGSASEDIVKRPGHGGTTRKGRETRERIFAASIRLITERGYGKSTIPDICAEAGISTGNFYHHFHAKSDILIAYVREESDRLLEYYGTLDGIPRMAALLSCVERFFGYYSLKGRNFVATFLSILLAEGGSWFSPDELAIQFIVRDCLERGAGAGEFPDEPRIAEAMELATGLVWDLSCSWCVAGGPDGLADLAKSRFGRLLELIRK